MRLRLARIRKKSRSLLAQLEIQKPPVPVAELARSCGARIVRVSGNEDDIDGFLYQEDDDVVIGINRDQAAVRQRFTVAHELGHLLLHEHSRVYVDRWVRRSFRPLSLASEPRNTRPRLGWTGQIAPALILCAGFLPWDSWEK